MPAPAALASILFRIAYNLLIIKYECHLTNHRLGPQMPAEKLRHLFPLFPAVAWLARIQVAAA